MTRCMDRVTPKTRDPGCMYGIATSMFGYGYWFVRQGARVKGAFARASIVVIEVSPVGRTVPLE
jgi:hypothetical protein